MLRSKVCSPCFSHPVSLAFSVCCSVSTYFLSGICSICHMTMYHVRTYVDLQRLRRELAMTSSSHSDFLQFVCMNVSRSISAGQLLPTSIPFWSFLCKARSYLSDLSQILDPHLLVLLLADTLAAGVGKARRSRKSPVVPVVPVVSKDLGLGFKIRSQPFSPQRTRGTQKSGVRTK